MRVLATAACLALALPVAADPTVWTRDHVETVEMLESAPRRVLITLIQYVGYSHSRALALVAPGLESLPDSFCVGDGDSLLCLPEADRYSVEGVTVLSSGPEDLILLRSLSRLPDTLTLLQIWYPFRAPAESSLVRWALRDGEYRRVRKPPAD